MNLNTKNVVITALVIAVISILLQVFSPMGLLLSLVIGFVGGLIVSVFLFSKSRGDKPEDVVKEMVEQVVEPDHLNRAKTGKNTLISFQESFVLASPSDELREKVFALSDELFEVIFPINEKFHTHEISWEVTQMAIEHLPNRVLKYLKLGEEDRESNKTNLLEDLENMLSTVKKVSEVLRNSDLNDNNREDVLSDIKYSSNL